MAKNTKGDGSLEQNGVIVVTPDNIGKGIEWNAQTRKFDVKVAPNQPIVFNDKGELEVRVSKLENNQLRIMKDGIYYGNQARPELANLYVDVVSGVDQNPLTVQGAGTRAKPLKTVAFAIKQVETGSSSKIHLHEDQEHILDRSNEVIAKNNVVINFVVYGAKNDEQYNNTGHNQYLANIVASREGYAPKLVFKGFSTQYYRSSSGEYTRVLLNTLNLYDCSVSFGGIHLVNDLGFTASVTSTNFDHVKDSPNYVTNASRIALFGNGLVETRCCRFSSRGTPRLQGDLGRNVSTENNFDQYQANYSGKWNSSIFMTNGNYSFMCREIYGLDDLACYYLGSRGWGVRVGSNVSVIGESGIRPNLQALTSRIYEYTLFTEPSGDKVILSPTTNIPASEWASYK